MPLPMIHLAVAVGVHTLAGREPSAAFLLGSIAPDAIHMRDGADRSDKERTHLEGRRYPRRWLGAPLSAAARLFSGNR